LNLPSRHSITSGAGEQLVRYGEAERFGGFEVDHKFILGRRLHRQIGRLFAFENAIDVLGRAPELFDLVNAVTDQAAAHDVAAVGIDRGQPVPRGKRDDQLAVHEHARAWRGDQAVVRLAGECDDSALDVAGIAGIDRARLDPERWRHRLDAAEQRDLGGDPRIPQSTATRITPGAISLSSSSHFAANPNSGLENPVVLPPGRARLATRLPPTGSMTFVNTIGTLRVAFCSALTAA